MKTIRKQIEIAASKERVWQVLLNDEYTRRWYEAFSPGSHAETDWKVGSKALFTDDKSSGLIAKIVANKPAELLSMQFQGMVNGGKEDCESDAAKDLQSGYETYRLSETGGKTSLSIECDMDTGYFEMMSQAWEKALQELKKIAEND